MASPPPAAADIDELDDLTAERVAARVDFQLSYHRSKRPRKFHSGGITGESLDNAYGGDSRQSGDWEDDAPAQGWRRRDRGEVASDTDQLRKYVTMAAQEGVHEVLEWLVVDGQRWLDPHGDGEACIHEAVGRLVADLHKIREREVALLDTAADTGEVRQ